MRPLLWAQRADVLAYLARCGVPHVTDATNDTDAYARNRIRHGVLPALERAHPGAARRRSPHTFCTENKKWNNAIESAPPESATITVSPFCSI